MLTTYMGRVAKLLAILAATLVLGAASAQDTRDQAVKAGIADVVTTAIGLAAGAAEANPLGLITIPAKFAFLRWADKLPDTERPAAHALAASFWGGAAANNLCVAASVLSGGAFAPVCLAVGVAWGYHTWKSTERERIFWAEGCPGMRQYANEPGLKCIYTPPPKEPVTIVWVEEIVPDVAAAH